MGEWNEGDHPREQRTKRFAVKRAGGADPSADLEADDAYGSVFSTPVDPDSTGQMGVEQERVLEDAVRSHATIGEFAMARRRRYVERVLDGMPDTQSRFSTVDDQGRRSYTPERLRLQDAVIDRMMDRARDVPCDRRALMTGGIGGAGKSSSLRAMGVNGDEWLTLNNDDIKEEMARAGMIPKVRGLTPMESCPLVHEEASDMLARMRRRALDRGMNVIVDGTMSSYGSTSRKIGQLHDAGYEVRAMFVDVSVDTAKRRAFGRYRRSMDEYTTSGVGVGGRWLPERVIESQRSDDPGFRTVNAETFGRLAREGVFDGEPAVFDNDVDGRGSRRLRLDSFIHADG